MSSLQEKDQLCKSCENQADCPILDMLEETISFMAVCSSYEKKEEPMTREELFLRNGQ